MGEVILSPRRNNASRSEGTPSAKRIILRSKIEHVPEHRPPARLTQVYLL